MNSRVIELSTAGINISLTPKGQELLAKIMNNGCPVKLSYGKFVHIKCPYNYTSTKFSCEVCWKKWLKEFVKED